MDRVGAVFSETINEYRSFLHNTIHFFQNVFDYERIYGISQEHGTAPHTKSIIDFWLLRILSIYCVLNFYVIINH